MEYYFAPMEGITGGEFRQVHHRHFFGVDKYYMPFISPTREHLFTQRERRNIDPEVNRGIPAVPQLLTKSSRRLPLGGQQLWERWDMRRST